MKGGREKCLKMIFKYSFCEWFLRLCPDDVWYPQKPGVPGIKHPNIREYEFHTNRIERCSEIQRIGNRARKVRNDTDYATERGLSLTVIQRLRVFYRYLKLPWTGEIMILRRYYLTNVEGWRKTKSVPLIVTPYDISEKNI